jgi:hypothetical protein
LVSGLARKALNDKQTGSIVAVMQRLHEDDLAGHLAFFAGKRSLPVSSAMVFSNAGP